MAQQRSFFAADYGAQAPAVPRGRLVADPIDTPKERMKPPRLDHFLDRSLGIAEPAQLLQRDHPVLRQRNRCQPMVTSSFGMHMRT